MPNDDNPIVVPSKVLPVKQAELAQDKHVLDGDPISSDISEVNRRTISNLDWLSTC